jgi:ribosomal protein S18 acetylase RimI-like enzyme
MALEAGSDRPLAMAWATKRPFWVGEIDATLDPGGGTYLFGDFVAPAHRGRGLQRLLVAERLNDAPRACTIVHPDNAASVRSYGGAGFADAGRFTRYRWVGRSFGRCSASAGAPARFELAVGDTIRARWSL